MYALILNPDIYGAQRVAKQAPHLLVHVHACIHPLAKVIIHVHVHMCAVHVPFRPIFSLPFRLPPPAVIPEFCTRTDGRRFVLNEMDFTYVLEMENCQVDTCTVRCAKTVYAGPARVDHVCFCSNRHFPPSLPPSLRSSPQSLPLSPPLSSLISTRTLAWESQHSSPLIRRRAQNVAQKLGCVTHRSVNTTKTWQNAVATAVVSVYTCARARVCVCVCVCVRVWLHACMCVIMCMNTHINV